MSNTHFTAQLFDGAGTLTLEIYARNDNTLVNIGGDTATEDGTRSGYYDWTVSHAVIGTHDCIIKDAAGSVIAAMQTPDFAQNDTGEYALGENLVTPNEADIYPNGIVYAQSGQPGAVFGINGTPGNPSSTVADVQTLMGLIASKKLDWRASQFTSATNPRITNQVIDFGTRSRTTMGVYTTGDCINPTYIGLQTDIAQASYTLDSQSSGRGWTTFKDCLWIVPGSGVIFKCYDRTRFIDCDIKSGGGGFVSFDRASTADALIMLKGCRTLNQYQCVIADTPVTGAATYVIDDFRGHLYIDSTVAGTIINIRGIVGTVTLSAQVHDDTTVTISGTADLINASNVTPGDTARLDRTISSATTSVTIISASHTTNTFTGDGVVVVTGNVENTWQDDSFQQDQAFTNSTGTNAVDYYFNPGPSAIISLIHLDWVNPVAGSSVQIYNPSTASFDNLATAIAAAAYDVEYAVGQVYKDQRGVVQLRILTVATGTVEVISVHLHADQTTNLNPTANRALTSVYGNRGSQDLIGIQFHTVEIISTTSVVPFNIVATDDDTAAIKLTPGAVSQFTIEIGGLATPFSKNVNANIKQLVDDASAANAAALWWAGSIEGVVSSSPVPTKSIFTADAGEVVTTLDYYEKAFVKFVTGANKGIARAITRSSLANAGDFQFLGATNSNIDFEFPNVPVAGDRFVIEGREGV